MFTSVPMVRVELLVLDRDLEMLSGQVGEMRVLHPVEVATLGPWAASLEWAEIDELASEYSSTERRFGRAAESLRLESGASGLVSVSPAEVAAGAKRLLDQVEPEIRSLESRLHDLQSQRARLDGVQAFLDRLSGLRVDLSRLRSLNHLAFAFGLLPQENLQRLEESLHGVPHLLSPLSQEGDRLLLFAFASRQDWLVVDRALQSAYLERLEIPAGLSGTPSQAMVQLLASREELDAGLAAAEEDRSRLRERWGDQLTSLEPQLEANGRVVSLWQKVGRTSRTRLLVGWLPRQRLPLFADRVAQVTEGRAVLASQEPNPEDDSAAGLAPTQLRNPGVLHPFEGLTRIYGLPNYWDVDPTLLSGPLFVLFFGAMFGDLGEGLVLAAGGLLLAAGRLLPGQRDFGRILAACGFSSMLFGVLYGEVFGSEAILSPLWFRPLEDPLRLIGIAVGLGILVLSVGLVFGVLGAWRRKDRVELFFGQNGLAGLWLYWGLVATALTQLLAPSLLSWWGLLLLIGLPALLIFLHGPITHALGWQMEMEGGTYFIQSGVETFDLIIRLVSNTVSFLRVGAFALGHIGLGLTVFALAGLVRGVPGVDVAVIFLGNVLIIALEGLIVGIQALRLEYYELFTKFFRGQGKAYAPFTLGQEEASGQ